MLMVYSRRRRHQSFANQPEVLQEIICIERDRRGTTTTTTRGRRSSKRKLELPEKELTRLLIYHHNRCGFDGNSITERVHSTADKPMTTMDRRGIKELRRIRILLLVAVSLLLLAGSSNGSHHHHHRHHHHNHSTALKDRGLKEQENVSPLKLKAETSSESASATITLDYTTTEKDNNNNNNSSNDNTIANRIKIPGLYDERENPWITPLQGQANFERSIYASEKQVNNNNNKSEVGEPKISLIQYYMATCPDCQGFSPYFKRFVWDIGPHWRHLVRVYTINCNDEMNINLCWQQNPNLIVPLVRWYTFPRILSDSTSSDERIFVKYPTDLLNVAHRGYIKKQRRDLISLRHATLRYIESVLVHLSQGANKGRDDESITTNKTTKSMDPMGEFYSELPIAFKLLRPLGGGSGNHSRKDRQESDNNGFYWEIIARTEDCLSQVDNTIDANDGANVTIENFIVFEKPGSYVGKTLVADWSNWTCVHSDQAKNRLFMFHYSDNLNLLKSLKVANSHSNSVSIDHGDAHSMQPLLLSVETGSNIATTSLDRIEFHLLASNHSHHKQHRTRRHTTNLISEQQHNQHLSLEKYYASRKFRDPMAKNSYKVSLQQRQQQPASIVKKRLRRSSSSMMMKPNDTKVDYNEAENINWGPEYIYPGEESIRYKFNEIVARKISKFVPISGDQIPGANFMGENPGEIPRAINNGSKAISPKDDDLTLLKLTDYYKVLDEIIHKNILSRAQLDGYQLMTSVCFIRHLSRQFPFQGLQNGQQKSFARHYLELLYQKFNELMTEKRPKSFHSCSGNLLNNQRDELEKLVVSSRELQEIQNNTRKEYNVGLPSEKNFKWQYCAGSSEYLRGHTCSLWILFHTLTVQEYLNRDPKHTQDSFNCTKRQPDPTPTTVNDDAQESYKFMVKYSENKTKCDPSNPEPALVSAKTSELFEEPMHFVLSNIINFVRYYLSCTNCAAHFSCMVKNSPGLNLCNPKPDDHILWLWEAHNRVNVRTKATHSEDPGRPKHVFPVYEACNECYLEKPTNQTSFEEMKFNRKTLVDFIVARYRKTAILNNKIKIEKRDN